MNIQLPVKVQTFLENLLFGIIYVMMKIDDFPGKSISYHAAGGVVVFQEKVLLLNRPSRGEIRLPKGHIEPHEEASKAAKREIEEESGYTHLEIITDLGIQSVAFEFEGKQIVRTDHYFLMKLTNKSNKLDGENQFEAVWYSWDEAEAQLTFEIEREWVRRARKALNQNL